MNSILSMSSGVSRIANTSSRILRTLEGSLFGLLIVDNDDGNEKNSIQSWLLLQSWSRIVAIEGNTMLTLFKSGNDDDCDASVLLFSDDSFFWEVILFFGRISRGFRLECKKASVWMNNKNLSLGQSYKKKIMRTRRLTFCHSSGTIDLELRVSGTSIMNRSK